MNDYRCTPYCPPYGCLSSGKRELLKEIRKKHPRTENIYSIVRARGSEEHRAFLQLYHCKCVYCGCSVNIIPIGLFHVDHLKPKSDEHTDICELNSLDNLVLACQSCNTAKSDFWFPELSEQWSPDGDGIAELFFRDELFYIRVNPSHEDSKNVLAFYEQLKLFEQFRRLDYLLMSIQGYASALPEESTKRQRLNEILVFLMNKRNLVGI